MSSRSKYRWPPGGAPGTWRYLMDLRRKRKAKARRREAEARQRRVERQRLRDIVTGIYAVSSRFLWTPPAPPPLPGAARASGVYRPPWQRRVLRLFDALFLAELPSRVEHLTEAVAVGCFVAFVVVLVAYLAGSG